MSLLRRRRYPDIRPRIFAVRGQVLPGQSPPRNSDGDDLPTGGKKLLFNGYSYTRKANKRCEQLNIYNKEQSEHVMKKANKFKRQLIAKERLCKSLCKSADEEGAIVRGG